jgi:protein-tyrosine phosphatase
MVAAVDANRRAGRTTFVHCRNGVSRSGMVVTAYLMWKNDPDPARYYRLYR